MRSDRQPARLDGQPTFIAFARAALIGAVLGAVLFLFEQAHVFARDHERLPPILAAVYMVLFAGLGLLAAALLRVGDLPGEALPARTPLAIASGAYYLLVAGAYLVRWQAGASVHGGKAILLALVPLLLASGWVRIPGQAWIRTVAAAVLALGWAFTAIERSVFGSSPFAWWGHALFLALALALLLDARRAIRLPRIAEPAALAALLLAAFGLHVYAGTSLFREPGRAAERRPADPAPAPAAAASAPAAGAVPVPASAPAGRGAASDTAAGRAGARRPNVVLVVWDGVRRGNLSVYGYGRPTTPYLEELGRRSLVFTRATTVAPWTLPSHASMFTGLYPRSHGAHSYYVRGMDARGFYYHGLPAGAATLAERLRAAGYRCGAVSANFYFAGRRVGLGRGFDSFFDDRNPLYLDPVAGFRLAGRIMAALEPRLPMGIGSRLLTPYITAREVSDRALAFADAGEPGRPFFLFLNYMEAHEPYNPAARHRHRYPGFRRPQAFAQVRDVWFGMLAERRPIRPAERGHLVSQYDAALMTLDDEARRLAAELARRGVFDDTLIIFTSDHGEFLGEHGLTGHGQDVYEEVVGIPMIVKLPGERRRGRVEEPFENRDVYHLILAETGAAGDAPARNHRGGRASSAGRPGAGAGGSSPVLPGSEAREGSSARPGAGATGLSPARPWAAANGFSPARPWAAANGFSPARPWAAASERYPAAPNPLADGTPVARLTRGRRAFYFGPYKLIASTDGEEELYDLARDPHERENLVRALPAEADRGRELVRRFLLSIPEAAPRQGAAGSPEEIERLRALGYAN